MKNKLTTFAALTIILVSCGESKKDALLEFNISFDELAHYLPNDGSIIKNSDSHSGIYCLMADSTHVFNAVFESKIQDLTNKEIKKITVEGFVKPKSENSKGCFVISIQDPVGNATDWAGFEISQVAKTLGEWAPFKIELEPKPESKNPESLLKIYGWSNNSSDETYFDDIHVIIE